MDKDNDLYFDQDFEMAFIEQENQNNVNQQDEFDDEFGEDLDLTELVEVTETVEQQHAANTGHISFVSTEDDPIPPPALPESTPSFHPLDVNNLRTWIYPTNYPLRSYQFNIVKKAMFSNTLVSLPTGLGKTFIAAVVMYNYWRWFPNSKIIFMAPTRPLVHQQIEACFSICGLPQQDTVDISGSILPAKRGELWKTKHVFFATPQTMDNDLRDNRCPAEKVVCIVVDEAHRAVKNYAYTGVVKKLSTKNQDFRVLALTATPGSKLETVQNVVENLKIANIQIRTEDSMDVREFTHGKNIQRVVVRLNYTEGSSGLMPRIREEFRNNVFQPMITDLLKNPIPANFSADADSIATYSLTMCRNTFNATARNLNPNLKFYIGCMFLVAEQMSRAYDMLCQHGMASFLESIENTRQETEAQLAAGKKLNRAFMQYYNHPYIKTMIPYLKHEMQKPNFVGHPKIDHLVSILLKHFSDVPAGQTSKVMIFSSYRSSVLEICRVLDQHRPIIRSSFFVGQSDGKNGAKGLKQFEQQEVIQKFKRDEFNVLVSTSIGEEGLDIGEVDLILCYDSQQSPIRMLQRMGRTGRKRQGKCILLLTEIEERHFDKANDAYKRIQRQISQGHDLNYYKENPIILPANYKPTVCRKVLDIGNYQQKEINKKRKRGADVVATTNINFTDGLLTDVAEKAFVRSFCNALDTFTNINQLMNRYWPVQSITKLSLGKYVPLQTRLKPIHRIGHSKRTIQFIKIVQNMEQRILHPEEEIKFDMPKKQTILLLPTKASAASSSRTLIMPKRNKKKTMAAQQTEDLHDAFDDFMEQHVSRFVDDDDFAGDNFTHKNDFFARKSSKKMTTADASPPNKTHVDTSRDKGKGKMRQESEEEFNTSFDDMDQADMSWDPMLPESVFEQVDPFEDCPSSTTELKINATRQWKERIDDEDRVMIPMDKPPPATKDRVIDNDDDEFGYDDDFDFAQDDFLLAETEAMLISSGPTKGFDDPLLPVFPFEKETKNTAALDTIAVIWTQTKPSFSKKGLDLLKKRQHDVKELTGKFVAMNIFTNYHNSKKASTTPSMLSQQQQQSQSQHDDVFDDDSFFAQAAALETSHPQDEVSSIHNSQSCIEYEEDEGFDGIDFNEATFANFYENKFSEEEEGGGHHQEYAGYSSHASNMKAKASLYGPVSLKKPQVVEDEIFYEYDFDATPSPPSITDELLPLVEKDEIMYNATQVEDEFDLNDPLLPPRIQDVSAVQSPSLLSPVRNSPISDTSIIVIPETPSSRNRTSIVQEENDSDVSPPPFKKRLEKKKNPVILQSDDDGGDESPTKRLLPLMSKGLYPPISPMKDSPLRNNNMRESDSDESPIVLQRKKRRVIQVSPPQESRSSTKKRLKRKAPTTPLSIMIEDDEEEIVFEPPSKNELLQKLKQSGSRHPNKKHYRIPTKDVIENPFMDVEAEQSSDEGHTDDGDGDSAEEEGSSFIDDESVLEPEISNKEKHGKNNMYMQSLLQDDNVLNNKKHWMNRFDASKWLNVNQEEEDIIEEDEEGEEEEEEEEESIIEPFSSDLLVNNNSEIDDPIDDDDFMLFN